MRAFAMCIALLCAASLLSAAVAPIQIWEVDGVAQTNRVHILGMAFKQGDIANCAVPVIGGSALNTSSYQCDAKTRWPDGSLQTAGLAFIASLTPGQALTVPFQSGVPNNAGFLDKAGMIGFNSGNWDLEMLATAAVGDPALSVTSIADAANTATVTTSTPHSLTTGDTVRIYGATVDTDLNHDYSVTVVSATVFTVTSSNVTDATYTEGTLRVSKLHNETVTTSAKAMLSALAVGRCQIEYELQGPVATQVRVQDCTAAMSFDFGWHWNGTTMADNSGTPFVTTSQYASLHPFCDLTFVPSTNSVLAQCGIKNQWNGKRQDQVYSLEIKVGSPLVSVLTKSTFTHFEMTNWRKSFWSGTAPGHTRPDWNFPYLISTKLFANYDLTTNVTSKVNPSTEYTSFTGGDMGDIMGHNLMNPEMADNSEGAMEQTHNLRLLYLMNSCGTVNGLCAKAWDMLTGEVDANPANTLVGVNGGGGDWAAVGSIPIHADESRTGLKFFCPSYDTPNATQATTCDGTEDAQGHPISRDADRNVSKGSITAVGTATLNSWNTEGGCEHWLEYSFIPAILLASRYQREELYAAATHCTTTPSASAFIFGGANGFFANTGAGAVSIRRFAWGVHTTAKAALVAPDGTVEKSYYAAKVRSNLMLEEGIMGITGTSLSPTPGTANASCSGYVANPNNRWNYAHCTIGRGVFPALNGITNGQCTTGDAVTYLDPATSTDFSETYFEWFGIMAFNDLARKGFSDISTILGRFGTRIVEQILDPGYNHWLVGTEILPIKNGTGVCTSAGTETYSDSPHFTTWAGVLSGYLASIQAKTNFTSIPNNFPCADHGYSLLARGAAAAAVESGITSGSYTAADAWAWISAQQPYFGTGGLPLGYCNAGGDDQLKFALLPSLSVTPSAAAQYSGSVRISGGVH